MNENLQDRLLGGGPPDPGCEACFEILDTYAEAVLRGADAERLFPEVVAHLAGCADCREDTAGLLAVLRHPPSDDSR